MADIYVLPSILDQNGVQHLVAALKAEMTSGRDLGPRGPQMQAIGHSLEQSSLQLRRELESFVLEPVASNPNLTKAYSDMIVLREELLQLAEAFAELGVVAKAYTA
ncbi:hypothetical protein [Methylobacterium sp. B1]|uniref:hypothetical protein n=1 Tax=Methylobacterium sp. B1 TaxID=91459 RepID=UPI000346D801|nr:hypothetical protein [Methylobacterium sp. B1]